MHLSMLVVDKQVLSLIILLFLSSFSSLIRAQDLLIELNSNTINNNNTNILVPDSLSQLSGCPD